MLSQGELEELHEFDTALLANTVGFISNIPTHEFYLSGEIQSVTPLAAPTVGIAFTCEMDSSTPGNVAQTDLFWEQLGQMADYHLPIVWVVQTKGSRPDHECVLGDGMAKNLHSVGCKGVVTDGRVRDIAGLLSIPFAAYCRGKVIHHVPMRFLHTNRPVEVGGVTIHPGDIIHANSEGVIRLPSTALNGLAESAVKMRAFESKAHMVLRRSDIPLPEKRKRLQDLMGQYGFADCIETPSHQ